MKKTSVNEIYTLKEKYGWEDLNEEESKHIKEVLGREVKWDQDIYQKKDETD